MRNWVSIAITAVVALAIGYSLRPAAPSPEINLAPKIPKTEVPLYTSDPETSVPSAPQYPKPLVETPVPTVLESTALIGSPEPMVGKIPSLPNAFPGGPSGSIGPLAPDVPTKLPTADLKADEALARRTILQRGGEIVASSDAKDSSGKVGTTLVVEIGSASAKSLRSWLQKALGDRVVLSDAGIVSSPNPTLKKAEEALAEAKKKVEQARVDFLPQAPALRQVEEDYLTQERAVAELRRASSRLRINVLLRPTLGG